MQPIKTDAIILRRTNYGEADRILQVLTPNHDKIGVMAKGVRREKSKLAGAVELFSVSELVILPGKNRLATLTGARLKTFYGAILSDYDRLQFGYLVLKRINQIAEQLKESALFTVAVTSFDCLNNFAIDAKITQAWFYLQVGEVLGQGLNLSRDSANQALADHQRYRFDTTEMSFAQHPSGTITSEHLKLLKLLKIKTPSEIARISGTQSYIDECLSLARMIGE